MTLRLNSLEEVEGWVLSFGKHATVVGPEELKRRVFETTEELWQRYGGARVVHDQRKQKVESRNGEKVMRGASQKGAKGTKG